MKLAFQGSRSLKKKREEVLKIIETEIKKHNKYYKLDKTEHKQSINFEIDKGWEWDENDFKEIDLNI